MIKRDRYGDNARTAPVAKKGRISAAVKDAAIKPQQQHTDGSVNK